MQFSPRSGKDGKGSSAINKAGECCVLWHTWFWWFALRLLPLLRGKVRNHEVGRCISSTLGRESRAEVVTGWGNYLGSAELLELPLGAQGFSCSQGTARTLQVSLGSALPPPSEHPGPSPACAFLLLLHCSQPHSKTTSILTHLNFFFLVIFGSFCVCGWN